MNFNTVKKIILFVLEEGEQSPKGRVSNVYNIFEKESLTFRLVAGGTDGIAEDNVHHFQH